MAIRQLGTARSSASSRVRALAVVALFIGILELGTACADRVPPNVLLVTLDTTRADHLGVYGHRRDTSPNLDALAAEALVFRNAHSTSTWTLPSHASLFTGKLPTSHGARYDPEGPLRLGSVIDPAVTIRARGLAAGETTLARILSGAGYATAGFAGGPWLHRTFGLSAGFEHWDDAGVSSYRGRRAEDLSRAAVAWLSSRTQDTRPFFVFVNFFDAHFPYDAPPGYAQRFLSPAVALDPLDRTQFDALYDAEIRYADHHLGVLLDFLRERGVFQDTLVVVTADHGEQLGEHGGWGHNGIPFEPVVHIPLVVKPPGPPRPGVEERPIQLCDVFALILETAGIRREPAPGPSPLIAEVWHPPDPGVGEWKVLWDPPLKYMRHDDGQDRLYDLEQDPRERVNRIDDRPQDARRLRERLQAEIASLPGPPPAGEAPVVDDATREALEQLGYIDPAATEATTSR